GEVPDDVGAVARMTGTRTRAGGRTTTESRSLAWVRAAPSPQAAMKAPPVSRPRPSKRGARMPSKHSANIPSSAPRRVSLSPAGALDGAGAPDGAAAAWARPLLPAARLPLVLPSGPAFPARRRPAVAPATPLLPSGRPLPLR